MLDEKITGLANYILDNKDQKNTPEYQNVVKVYQELRANEQKHPTVSTGFISELGQGTRYGIGAATMPARSVKAGMEQVAATNVQTGTIGSFLGSASPMGGMQPMGRSEVPQFTGTQIEDSFKKAQESRDSMLKFKSELEPDFQKRHPEMSLFIDSVAQIPFNVLTGMTTTPFQHMNEHIMASEDNMGKSFENMTDEERDTVQGAAIVPVAINSSLDVVSTLLGGGGIISRFLSGTAVKKGLLKDALQRGGEALGAAGIEGATESLQQVVSNVNQLVSGIDKDEITIGNVLDGSWKAFRGGFYGGAVASGGFQTMEVASNRLSGREFGPLGTSEQATQLDKTFFVQYTDTDGNSQTMKVNGPDMETVSSFLDQEMEGQVQEGTKVNVVEESLADENFQGWWANSHQQNQTDSSTQDTGGTSDFVNGILPVPSQQEVANASATYVNKKYVGPNSTALEKLQVSAPNYFNFLKKLKVPEYRQGVFLDVRTGENLTDRTFAGGSVSINENGKPIMITDDTEVFDIDIKDKEFQKTMGPQVKVNLFKSGAKRSKWDFVENPQNLDIGTIVSVQDSKKHYYTLDYQSNNPIMLENTPFTKSGKVQDSPQGKPVTRGKVKLGNPVARIVTKVGKKRIEHNLYDRITVGEPKDILETNKLSGPVSIARVVKNNELNEEYFKTEQGFFEFYEAELRKTGSILRATPENYKAVSKSIMEDVTTFFAANPQLVGFYEKDAELTGDYLKEALKLTDSEVKLAAVVSGMNSNNTGLKSNTLDDVKVMESWKRNKNFDEIVLINNRKYDKTKSKVLLSAKTNVTKAKHLKALERILRSVDGTGPGSFLISLNAVVTNRGTKYTASSEKMVVTGAKNKQDALQKAKQSGEYQRKKDLLVSRTRQELGTGETMRVGTSVKDPSKMFGKGFANESSTIEKTVALLQEPVPMKELNRFNNEIGFKSKTIGSPAEVKATVMAATGQDVLIPRAFAFGPKIGAFIMNNLGNLNYTTVDIWESRFIRTFFEGMLDTTGLAVTPQEKDIFLDFGETFNKEFNTYNNTNLSPATLQAIRWFYIIRSFRDLGYRGAVTNEAKSEYTRRSIKEFLGYDIDSGRPSNEEGAQAERGGQRGGRTAAEQGPVERSLFELRGVRNQFSYKGREGQDTGASNRDAQTDGITAEDFAQIAADNKRNNEFGSSVDVFSSDVYNKNYSLIVNKAPDGARVTAAISNSGELSSVTKNKQATSTDVRDTIHAAIATGQVKWLQAFDTVLPEKYVPMGFKPVARLPFDPKQAPKDWSTTLYKEFNGGRPDIIFFAFDGELNREYHNYKKIPEVKTYEEGLASVENTDISAEQFPSVPDMKEAIHNEFYPIAKKIGINIVPNIASSRIAAYVAYDRQGGMYIEYNPKELYGRTKQGVRAAMREEIIHAVQHQIAMKMYPSLGKGEAWSKLMTTVGEGLTLDQRENLGSVYTSLETDKEFGAEYLRAATQYLLYGEASEQFVFGGASWKEVTTLFKETQQTVSSTFKGQSFTNVNVAEIVRDTAETLRGINNDIKLANKEEVAAAYEATQAKYINKNPNQAKAIFPGFQKTAAEFMVPFHQRLEDIHPGLRQLEVNRTFSINTKTQSRLMKAKSWIDKVSNIQGNELANFYHYLSYNPTAEEVGTPTANYYKRRLHQLLNKYNLADEYKVVRDIYNELYQESFAIDPDATNYRFTYYSRHIKDKEGLMQALEPDAINEYEAIISRKNRERANNKVLDPETNKTIAAPLPPLTDQERIKELDNYLRKGTGFKVKGVISQGNLKERQMDAIPVNLVQFYEHPANSIKRYIEGMTDTIESKIVYGQPSRSETGQILQGKMTYLADELQQQNLIGPDGVRRVQELVGAVMAKRTDYTREHDVLKFLRQSTYLMTIVDFDSAMLNFMDTEVVLGDTGIQSTIGGLIKTFDLDLTEFGIISGKDQIEFKLDNDAFGKVLQSGMETVQFHRADAIGKSVMAGSYLAQAQNKARQPVNSKAYQSLKNDIKFYFYNYTEEQVNSVIANLKVKYEPGKTPSNVAEYIFSKVMVISPISESNLTEIQMKYPNMNFAYSLKSYQLNKMNGMRQKSYNSIYQGIAKGDMDEFKKGLSALIVFCFYAQFMGVPFKFIYNFINNKLNYWDDMLLDNFFRALAFVDNYDIRRFNDQGPIAALGAWLSPATGAGLSIVDDVWKLSTDPEFTWDDMKMFKTQGPFNSIARQISGYDEQSNKRKWKKKVEEGKYPFLNDNYMGEGGTLGSGSTAGSLRDLGQGALDMLQGN